MFRTFMSIFGGEQPKTTPLFKPVTPLNSRPPLPKAYQANYNPELFDKADAEVLNQILKRYDPVTKEFQARVKEFEKFFAKNNKRNEYNSF
jgi:hypothetical protein